MVRRSLQTLIPSSPSTTSSGAKAPATGRTWCAAHRKLLFLRRRAPRLPGPRRRQRAGRGASLPANPYSFVTEHHVFRDQGAGNGPDVVRRSPQTLIPSSPSTTSSGAKATATGRTWCAAPRKLLFLRRRAPRLPGPRRRRWRDPTEMSGDLVQSKRRNKALRKFVHQVPPRPRAKTGPRLGAKQTEE